MRQDRIVRRSWRRLPHALGAVALTAAVTLAVLPAGTAQASPAATTAPRYSLDVVTHVAALGHTWTLGIHNGPAATYVSLGTTGKGTQEQDNWVTTSAFTAAGKELKVTGTGHATFSTGSALSPVLRISLSFSPVKVSKRACVKGSASIYSGTVSGSVSLVTGLRGVKVSVKFTGQAAGTLTADRSCVTVLPATYTCGGGLWILTEIGSQGVVLGAHILGPKPVWMDQFEQGGFKTASRWVTRSALVIGDSPAPKLDTAAKTVSVSGLSSGAVTGAAVFSYRNVGGDPPQTCTLGGKKYKQKRTVYYNGKVTTSKPFRARSLLAGTLTAPAANSGDYWDFKLSAA
jgi:hypothetical protein